MYFKKSLRGSDILVYKGYEFYKKREQSDGTIHWRCKMYEKCHCHARVVTYHDTMVNDTNAIHNHKSDEEEEEEEDTDDSEADDDDDDDDDDEDDEEEDDEEKDDEDDEDDNDDKDDDDGDDAEDVDADEEEEEEETDCNSEPKLKRLKPGVYYYYPKFKYV